jgi:8-oxo-dGTP diphosphatase
MVNTSLLEQLGAMATADGIEQFVVGAIVREGDKVLLLRRSADDFMGGIFELPSGKVEKDETLDAAVVREVDEETGLDVTDIRDYIGHFDYTSGSGKRSRQFNFAVTVARPEPVELQEHDLYRWVSLDEELPVTDAVKKVIDDYRELRAE